MYSIARNGPIAWLMATLGAQLYTQKQVVVAEQETYDVAPSRIYEYQSIYGVHVGRVRRCPTRAM